MTKPHLRRYLPYVVFAFALAFMAASGYCQEAADAGGGVTPAENRNIFQTIKEGGPLIMVIWIAIVATSVTMVTFIVQNLMQLRKDRLAPPPLVESLRQTLASGNYQEAWEVCNANNNYLANVLKAALSRIGRGKEAVEESIIEHGLREATLLRTRNSYLSVIGVISPMCIPSNSAYGMSCTSWFTMSSA